MASIRCGALDLTDVLQSFPVVVAGFPLKYLGLLLSVHRLKRSHFQYLADKISRKINTGWAKGITMAGRWTYNSREGGAHCPSYLFSHAFHPSTRLD